MPPPLRVSHIPQTLTDSQSCSQKLAKGSKPSHRHCKRCAKAKGSAGVNKVSSSADRDSLFDEYRSTCWTDLVDEFVVGTRDCSGREGVERWGNGQRPRSRDDRPRGYTYYRRYLGGDGMYVRSGGHRQRLMAERKTGTEKDLRLQVVTTAEVPAFKASLHELQRSSFSIQAIWMATRGR